MCYNPSCHAVRYGALFISSADVSIAYRYWVKHPVLLDNRPADCVTTSASNTGCFVMTAKNGKPCKKCGANEWHASGACAPCTRERARQWRQANPDRAHDNRLRWFKANPEKKVASDRKWVKNNPEKSAESKRRWKRANPEKGAEYSRRWDKANPEKAAEMDRRWARENPEKAAAKVNRRRTLKTAAGGSYTVTEWKTLVNHYGGKCLCCGRGDVKLTADHVIPVTKGGTSNIDNIQPLCQSCNSRKCDREIDYRPGKGLGQWIQRKLFR